MYSVYFGHCRFQQQVDAAKVAAIKQMPILKSVQDVCRFLGMCNYLAQFIPKLSQVHVHVSEPLRKLLEAERVFQWGDAELKILICEDQLLHFFNVSRHSVQR